MALEGLRDALYARLLREDASDGQKLAWRLLWKKAQEKPGEPLPCPMCFLHLNAIIGIDAKVNDGRFAVATCPACKSAFSWLDDA